MNAKKTIDFGDYQLWCVTGPAEIEKLVNAMATGAADGVCISAWHGFSATNLEFLSEVPNLRILAVTDAAKVDISSIAKLTGLEYLAIDEASGSIDFQVFPCLTELRLQEGKGRSLPIAGLPGLRRLALWGCKENTLQFLENYPQLEHLEIIQARRLVSMDGVENASKITQLNVSYCAKLEAIDAVGRLVELRSLQFENVKKISDYASLARLTQLKRLFIKKAAELTSLGILRHLTNLESLVLRKVKIGDSDLSPLLGLPKLQHLHLDNKKEYEPLHERLKELVAGRALQKN